MIEVSDKFKEIMSNRLRPKAEPKITLSGKDTYGNDIKIEWTSHDISDFTYKRGIDPVGRSLPYMSLSWKEIYTGKLGKGNTALKYNNVVPFMKVKLEITQNLSFWNTWKDFFNGTWKNVFSFTWREVMKKPISETIEFPVMYLVAKPVVKGQTITWEAKDFFYFLNNQQQVGFQRGINYRNPLRWFLLDERATFKDNDDFIRSLDETQKGIISQEDGNTGWLTVFEDKSKNILKDYASAKNYFWCFTGNKAKMTPLSEITNGKDIIFSFTADLMKSYPKITENSNISAYSFSQTFVKADTENEYVIDTPNETIAVYGQIEVNRFIFDDWGYIKPSENVFSPTTISKEGYSWGGQSSGDSVTVIPVSVTTTEMFINNNKQGEVFSEDNKYNFEGETSHSKTLRFELLDKYFNKESNVLSFECAPNFFVEPTDFVSVETNVYDGENKIIKSGVIVEQELKYNGAFIQKDTVHEVI